MGDTFRYPWASAHPWQGWRNRYCKNKERLDPSIEEYLDEHPQHRSSQEDSLSEHPNNDSGNIQDSVPSKSLTTQATKRRNIVLLSDNEEETEGDIQEGVPRSAATQVSAHRNTPIVSDNQMEIESDVHQAVTHSAPTQDTRPQNILPISNCESDCEMKTEDSDAEELEPNCGLSSHMSDFDSDGRNSESY